MYKTQTTEQSAVDEEIQTIESEIDSLCSKNSTDISERLSELQKQLLVANSSKRKTMIEAIVEGHEPWRAIKILGSKPKVTTTDTLPILEEQTRKIQSISTAPDPAKNEQQRRTLHHKLNEYDQNVSKSSRSIASTLLTSSSSDQEIRESQRFQRNAQGCCGT